MTWEQIWAELLPCCCSSRFMYTYRCCQIGHWIIHGTRDVCLLSLVERLIAGCQQTKWRLCPPNDRDGTGNLIVWVAPRQMFAWAWDEDWSKGSGGCLLWVCRILIVWTGNESLFETTTTWSCKTLTDSVIETSDDHVIDDEMINS